MQRKPIIGFAGKKGTGKDTGANYLACNHGYRRIGFADEVRGEVAQAMHLGWVPKEAPREIRDAFSRSTVSHVHRKPTSGDMRKILQWWGTEYRRSQDPDYWVKLLEAAVENETKPLAISDVRFVNEAEWVRSRGGQVWLVEGKTRGADGLERHASEDLDEIPVDAILYNTGTLDEYLEELRSAASVYLAGDVAA